MSALEHVAQSEALTLALALLNVAQTVWLADIAARARRVRRNDNRPTAQKKRGRPVPGRDKRPT